MLIVIVLLSAIVAFLFGGPLLGVAVLLIGLISVFPGIFGKIAAVIAVLIGLALLSQKFDININKIILIIAAIFGPLGIILAIRDKLAKEK